MLEIRLKNRLHFILFHFELRESTGRFPDLPQRIVNNPFISPAAGSPARLRSLLSVDYEPAAQATRVSGQWNKTTLGWELGFPLDTWVGTVLKHPTSRYNMQLLPQEMSGLSGSKSTFWKDFAQT